VVVPKGVVISWQDDFKKFISPASRVKMVVISEEAGPHAVNEVLNGDAHIVLTTYYRVMDSFRSLYQAAELTVFSKDSGLIKSQDQVEDCYMGISAWNATASGRLKEAFAFGMSPDGMSGTARDMRPIVNPNSKTAPRVSWVYAIRWSTLVFDESHKLRNSSTRNYVAAFFVDAQARVLVSGTPIQNSYHDLYTALRLLRVPRLLATGAWFGRGSMGVDQADYLDKMCKGHLIWIRKSDIPQLNMVTKRVFHRGAPFKNPFEEAYYNLWSLKAGKFAKEAAMKGKDKGTLKAARAEVMTAILRCRQACNAVFTIKDAARKSEIQDPSAFPGIADPEGWAGLESSKLSVMMEVVTEHIKDGPKFIILSGFVDMVDLIQRRLRLAGITAGKYTGSLTDAARSDVITKFKTDPRMRCLVLSLGAGSLGLSLELADRAIIVDPWWNPQVLRQAEDRIHRINSAKEVRITYLHISGTIEEAIMEVDQEKLEMENTIYEAVNIRSLLKSRAANPANGTGASAQGAHNRVEVVVNKAIRFWQENRKNDFCEECDFEQGRRANTPDQVMPDVKDSPDGRPSSSLSLGKRAAETSGPRASIRQTATGTSELSLIPLGEQHRGKQQKLDTKAVTPTPTRERSPPAAALVHADTVVDPTRSAIYCVSSNGVSESCEAWQVFNALSTAVKSITGVPPNLRHYVAQLVVESAEWKKIRAEERGIRAEAAANDGMLASACAAIEQSKSCNSFPESFIDQMKVSARDAVAKMLESKRKELEKYRPVMGFPSCTCEEFSQMNHYLHQILPSISVRHKDASFPSPMDFVYDPYLPLLALNPEATGHPPTLREIASTTLAPTDCSNARAATTAILWASTDVTCDMQVKGCDDKGSVAVADVHAFDAHTKTPEAAPCMHMAYYCGCLASLPGSSVKILRFRIGVSSKDDSHPMGFIASLFVHYARSKRSIQISDLAYANFGFRTETVHLAIDRMFASGKLSEVIESLVKESDQPPVHFICPRWMVSRLQSILLKNFTPAQQTWGVVMYQLCTGLVYPQRGPRLNPAQSAVFAPWWVEFVVQAKK